MSNKRPGAKKIKRQIELVEQKLQPDALRYEGLKEFTALIKMFFNYMEIEVDKVFAKAKKMHNHEQRMFDQKERLFDKIQAKKDADSK